MPISPLKPCSQPGCPNLSPGGKCDACAKKSDRSRGTATQRGYGSKWRKARIVFLNENPNCAECEKQGRIVIAKLVDHIIPHRGDMKLFWDRANWQSLCIPCHNKKIARGK